MEIFAILANVAAPKNVILETTTPAKVPHKFGPFKCENPDTEGLKIKRKVKAKLNYTLDKAVIDKCGADYFKDASWMSEIPDCTTFVSNRERSALYLRFLLVEVISETFWFGGEEIPPEIALKYMPPRKETKAPAIYMAIRSENCRFVEFCE